MWAAFFQLHLLLQRIYTLHFVYDPTASTFKINQKRNRLYYWINSQVFLVFCLSIRGILSFLTSTDPNVSFVNFIMDLLYWGLMSFIFISVWTHAKKTDEAVWLLNQMMTLKKPEELQDKRLSLGTLVMYSIALVVVIFPIALSALLFIFKETPTNIILRFALPHFIMRDKLTERILSSIYWLFHGFFATIPLMQVIAVVILALFDCKFMLSPCLNLDAMEETSIGFTFPSMTALKSLPLRKKKKEPSSEEKAPIPEPETPAAPPTSPKKIPAYANAKKKLQQIVRFPEAYHRYQTVSLVFASYNRFAFVLIPGLMFISFVLIVISTYVVIKLTGTLPDIMIAMMVVVDVAVTISSITTYAFGLGITNDSMRYEELWKGKLARLLYKKQLRTYRPIRVAVGSFFSFYQSIPLTHMQLAVEQTVNFLLV